MPLFARTPCVIVRRGATNLYGQRTPGAEEAALCAVVTFDQSAERTSVRTDSSATRGNAQERVAEIRLLFPPLYRIAIGEQVRLFDSTVEVQAVRPRLAVTGELDHHEVDCVATEAA